jgi:thymidylate synthase
MGDIHIYSSHVEAVQEQLKRHPFIFPSLVIKKDISSLKEAEELSFQDFEFVNYLHYSEIKAQMVA